MSDRFPVNYFAAELGTLPESVRAACNRTGVKIDPDDTFQVPAHGSAQYRRWMSLLAVLPCNRAEQLRADLGMRPLRKIPEA